MSDPDSLVAEIEVTLSDTSPLAYMAAVKLAHEALQAAERRGAELPSTIDEWNSRGWRVVTVTSPVLISWPGGPDMSLQTDSAERYLIAIRALPTVEPEDT